MKGKFNMDKMEKIRSLFYAFERPGFRGKNRFVRSATWLSGADDITGEISEAEIKRHSEIAAGGAGTLVTGLAYISPEGKALKRQWGLHNDQRIADVAKLAEEVHRCDSNLIVQLCHSGGQKDRHTANNTPAYSPSGIKHPGTGHETQALTCEKIREIAEDFAAAAARAKAGGADGVEIHAGHGFLFTQFLSPSINKRTDRYGGSLKNRAVIFSEVFREVRSAVGNAFPVWFKISIEEGIEGGYGPEDGMYAAASLLEKGVNAINVSNGTTYSVATRIPTPLGVSAGESEAPFRNFSRELKKTAAADRLIILSGGLRSMDVMADLIHNGYCDLLSLSRPFIAEPDLVNRWMEEDTRPSACVSCNACFKTSGYGLIGCPILRDRNEGNWDPL